MSKLQPEQRIDGANPTFAPDWERNEEGWILFAKNDQGLRRSLFPQEVFQHPAKANLYLVSDLVQYLTAPGDMILDPFGGTGSIMIAALEGRNVTTIELEDGYYKLQQRIYSEWLDTPHILEQLEASESYISQLYGNCKEVLPVPCDHAIFSPPYSTALGKSTGLKETGVSPEEWAKYSANPQNLGNLNPFLFGQTMKAVYAKLAQSVRQGGYMAVITKDIMRGGMRQHLSVDCIKAASLVGFKLLQWEKWLTAGSAQAKLMKSKGADIVEDEDVLMFRRG